MKTYYSFIACMAFLFCGAVAWGQEAPAADPKIDNDGLKKILEGLGYEPAEVKSGESVAWQVDLEHPSGETRKHLIATDPKAATVFIIGGGFSWAPDPKKASNEWFRRLLNVNHKMAPSYIFVNDFDVFGLTTVMGNVDINAQRLKAKIKEHVKNFDEQLVPLVKELPTMAKGEGNP